MDRFQKEALLKAQLLMERMDNHYTTREVDMRTKQEMLNEGLLEESKRINLPNLEAFFLKNKVNEGSFAKIGYIQIYPTDALYPNDDLYNTMSSMSNDFEAGRGAQHFGEFMDKTKNTEWDSPQGRAYAGNKSFKNKIYPYVLKLTTYLVNWQGREGFTKAEIAQKSRAEDIKNRVPSGLKDKYYQDRYQDETPEEKIERLKKIKRYRFDDGYLGDAGISRYMSGDEKNPEELKFYYREDPDDPNSEVEYNKTAIRNILVGDLTKRQKPQYFGVYADGSIDMIPKELGRLLHKPQKEVDNLANITDEIERKWAEEFFKNLNTVEMSNKTFLLTNIAYLAVTPSGGESVYWRNEHPLFLLSKSKTAKQDAYTYKINVNENELSQILEVFAKKSADDLYELENPNIR